MKNTMAKGTRLKLDRSQKNIKNKDSEEKPMGIMEIIPESILMEILSRLSAKEICIIRIVSKGINKITRKPEFAAKHAANGNLAGFFYQWREPFSPDDRYYINHKYKNYYDNEYRLVNNQFLGDLEFIPPGLGLGGPDDDVVTLSDPCLKFLKQKGKNSNEVVEIIDSCNGLLLCCTYQGKKHVTTYFVCNPLTKEHVCLPYPPAKAKPQSPSKHLTFAWLADTTTNCYLGFKVVCVINNNHRRVGDTQSGLVIFSWDTGEWKEFDDRLPPFALCEQNIIGSKVVIDKKLFWNCFEDHILVCHLNKKSSKSQHCYQLIEAPCSLRRGRTLWKAKDNKLLCYSLEEFECTLSSLLSFWSLCFNDEWKPNQICYKELEILAEDELCAATKWINKKRGSDSQVAHKIIGSKLESNFIYLWQDVHDELVRYDVKERDFKILWGFGAPTTSCVLPYMHNFACIAQINLELDLSLEDDPEELMALWRSQAKKRNNRKARRKNAAASLSQST